MPGEAIWAYCVTRAHELPPADMAGVDAAHAVEPVVDDGLAAWVSRVPLDAFGEAPLRENLNDFAWLEQVARRHEAVLERALAGGTIVPLRLCTIFDDREGAERMLQERHDTLGAALERLAGRQEWTVKLLLDRERLEAAAGEAASEPAPAGSGTAYLSRRRSERRAGEAADRLAATLAEEVHARLRGWADDAVINRPQNRELSGHQGEMALNGAYLVDATRAGQLRDIVDELGERHRDLGARLEVGGPLPPFNFAGRP